MKRVTHVQALPECRLRLRFSDGVEGTVDLSDMVGVGVFEHLRDPAEFGKVGVDPVTHTVTWPGGLDLCPDSLYEEITSKRAVA